MIIAMADVQKEKLLMLGAGGFGRQISEFARQRYDCVFLDDAIPEGELICGIPVVGKTLDMKHLFGEFAKLVVTIGDNHIREAMMRRAVAIGYDVPSLVFENAYISPYAVIGTGCIIMANALVQNESKVGDGVILQPNVEVHHGARIDDFAIVYASSCIRTQARVGKRAWIDSTVTIPNEAVIPDDGVVKFNFDGCLLQ